MKKRWGFLALLVAIVLVGIIPIDWEKVSGGRLTMYSRRLDKSDSPSDTMS